MSAFEGTPLPLRADVINGSPLISYPACLLLANMVKEREVYVTAYAYDYAGISARPRTT